MHTFSLLRPYTHQIVYRMTENNIFLTGLHKHGSQVYVLIVDDRHSNKGVNISKTYVCVPFYWSVYLTC